MTGKTAIDLFAGCGGMTYGLRQASFKVIAAVELDPVAVEVYRLNHPKTSLKETDIRALDAAEWMKELAIDEEKLDLLAGCPPCQGFSRLRTKNGAHLINDPRNSLVLEMLRLIKAFRPKAVMMENVPGLAETDIFNGFLSSLWQEGYSASWAFKNTRKFGVPQRRRRLILLAGRGFEIPFGNEAKKETTVRMAIGKLKPPGKTGDVLHDMPERRTDKMKEWIALIPKDGGSRRDLPDAMQRPCHKKINGFNDVYGRMAWDEVAPTITGSCCNPSKGRFLHPEENRNITMREAALLQTFPKSFKIPSGTTKADTAQMIGNALPPEFVRRQALSIAKALDRFENYHNA